MALGLKNLIVLNGAALTDGPIDWAHPSAVGQWSHAVLKGAREKLIEAFVMRRIGMNGLCHVHVVAFDKALNDPGGERAQLGTGQTAGQAGHGQLGHQVLRQHRQLIGHAGSLGSHEGLL